MACKLDIKSAITDKVAEMTKSMSPIDINRTFGYEVVKPTGRIFIPSELVDAYFQAYERSTAKASPAVVMPSESAKPSEVMLKKQMEDEINKLRADRRRLIEFKGRLDPATQADQIKRVLIQLADLSDRIDKIKGKITEEGVDFKRGFALDVDRVNSLITKSRRSKSLEERIRHTNEAQRIINFYLEAGNFEKGSNYLFESINLTNDAEMVELWRGFAKEMENYQPAVSEQYKDIVVKSASSIPSVKDYLDKLGIDKLTYEYFTQATEDKGWLSKMVLRPSKNFAGGNPAISIQVLEEMIRRQEDAGIRLRRQVVTQIDELVEKIKGKHKAYDVFKRYDKSGNFTGEIIHPYNTTYFEERREESKRKLKQIERLQGKTSLSEFETELLSKLRKEVDEWHLKNEINIDYSYLTELAEEFPMFSFETNVVAVAEYKAKLIRHFGTKGYESHLQNIREKLNEFKILRDYYQEMAIDDMNEFRMELGIPDGVEFTSMQDAMKIFDAIYSPFINVKDSYKVNGMDININGKSYKVGELTLLPIKNYLYAERAPRKYKGEIGFDGDNYVVRETDTLTGHYDKAFDRITADNDLYNFWSFAIKNLELARDMMPLQYRRDYQQNSIMFIEKTVMEEMATKGLFGTAYSQAYSSLISSLTDSELGTVATEENPFDPTRRNINYNFLGARKGLEDKLFQQKISEYFVKKGYPFTVNEWNTAEGKAAIREAVGAKVFNIIANDIDGLRKQAKVEVAEKASFDLGAVLKWHLGTMVALNQRDTILPMLELMERSVRDIKALKLNRAGMNMTNPIGELSETDLPVMNYVESVAHQLDVFTGKNVQKIEGVTTKKLYNLQEKAEMKKLEELKKQAKTQEQKDEIQKMQDAIGSVVTGSGAVDTALAYLRIKGLGWNLPAQIPNAAAGYYANFGLAADGRLVKMSSMRRAYNLFLNITMPSFLRTSANSEQVQKIKNLIERGDFLLDASSEMQKSRFGAETGKGIEKVLSPYTLTRMTEYMNQGVLVMARLMTTKIADKSGNMKPLWDALDGNLNLKSDFATEDNLRDWSWGGELMSKETTMIRKLIENTHGDYSETGRQMAKNYAAGRMAMFFKTWLPNVLHNRFGAYNPHDLTLGIATKGRYRSFTPGTAAVAGAIVGSWFAPGLGTAIGYGLGMSAAKIWGNDIHDSVMEDVKDSGVALGMLLKRLIYSKMSRLNPKYADALDSQFENYSELFDETDAANLRSNLHEMQAMLTLLLVYFLAKAVLFDDDEDKKNQLVHNFIINQILKIQGDLAFFMSPQSPGKLIEQALPITGLIDSSIALVGSATSMIYGMEVGSNENTFGDNFAKLLPSPLPRTTSLEKVFNEPKYLKYWFEESK